jgi:hypothetical protein
MPSQQKYHWTGPTLSRTFTAMISTLSLAAVLSNEESCFSDQDGIKTNIEITLKSLIGR